MIYERCAKIAGTAHSICEDYRASGTIDLVQDREDVARGRKLQQSVKVLWGEHGAVGNCFDVMALWPYGVSVLKMYLGRVCLVLITLPKKRLICCWRRRWHSLKIETG